MLHASLQHNHHVVLKAGQAVLEVSQPLQAAVL
jgi:hypothetical protein